jgi:DNA mismatch repair protein MutL
VTGKKEEMRIKVLDPQTVGMISAGEVIERPASVVKELVENSLDAGASKIVVEVQDAGRLLIRVVDDGIGMSREEVLLSLERYSTSKISTFSDLEKISTLGFRGEALPSIAGVSRMEIESKTHDQDAASRVVVHAGKVIETGETTRRDGTTVVVRDIFYKTPVRKKFLKSKGTELRKIVEVVVNHALSNPAVSFVLLHDGKEIIECEATDDLVERAACLYSGRRVRGLIPLKNLGEGVEVYGLISRPEDAGAGSPLEFTAVNGRPVRSPTVRHGVRRGFRATLKRGQRPDFLLFLKIDPADVDVNVHPTKLEVKFKDDKKIEVEVEEAVSKALSSPLSVPVYDRLDSSIGLRDHGVAEYGRTDDLSGAGTRPGPVDQMAFLFSEVEPSAAKGNKSSQAAALNEEVYYPSMVQVHRTFIIVQTRRGILILDQHASHERILYEKLMDSFAGGDLMSQKLLFPLTFHLTPAQYLAVMERLSVFRSFGFEIEPFGGKSIIIHSVPSLHRRFEVEKAFREIVEQLAENHYPDMKEHERVAKAIACKGALKAGQSLSRQEMCELFDTLFATRVPSRDIHGRPTMVQIGIEELRKRFERG